MKKKFLFVIVFLFISILILTACTAQKTAEQGRIQVVATTSILADVVRQVAGEYADVSSLVPLGINEHEYQPAPQDIARVSDADMVFEVGLGLEEFMSTIIENANAGARIVSVSDGITAKHFEGATGEIHTDEHAGGDPHVWLDPANVITWVRNIEKAMEDFDPEHAAQYQANSQAYIESLNQLDTWIMEKVSVIAADERMIVTDHMLFGYFAEKYGFKMIGAVIPSYSSSAQPSAQELAALEDAIRSYNVKAILVGNTVNPELSDRIAQDTGIQLVQIYTGSLSAADGPAGTYIDYIHYNVETITAALSR